MYTMNNVCPTVNCSPSKKVNLIFFWTKKTKKKVWLLFSKRRNDFLNNNWSPICNFAITEKKNRLWFKEKLCCSEKSNLSIRRCFSESVGSNMLPSQQFRPLFFVCFSKKLNLRNFRFKSKKLRFLELQKRKFWILEKKK